MVEIFFCKLLFLIYQHKICSFNDVEITFHIKKHFFKLTLNNTIHYLIQTFLYYIRFFISS